MLTSSFHQSASLSTSIASTTTSSSQSLPVLSTVPPQSASTSFFQTSTSATTVSTETPTTTNDLSRSVTQIQSSSTLPTTEPVYIYNVSTLAGSGSPAFADGVGLAASFSFPDGVVVDSFGSIFVADSINHRIRKISSLGNVTTLAGSGSAAFADGVGITASFNYPCGVVVDSNGLIYIGDSDNNLIRKMTRTTDVIIQQI